MPRAKTITYISPPGTTWDLLPLPGGDLIPRSDVAGISSSNGMSLVLPYGGAFYALPFTTDVHPGKAVTITEVERYAHVIERRHVDDVAARERDV